MKHWGSNGYSCLVFFWLPWGYIQVGGSCGSSIFALVQILLKNDKVAFVFVMIAFISLGQIFLNICKVKISRLDIVSLSRIKIHHAGIFFPLLLLLFLLFFVFFLLFFLFSFGRVRNTGESANFFWFSFSNKYDVNVCFIIYFRQNVEAAHVSSARRFYFSTMR